MESLLVQPTDLGYSTPAVLNPASAKAYTDAAALDSLAASGGESDTVSVSFDDLYKSLSLTARKVIDQLNQLLQPTLPGGIQSLKPEDTTSEATADRIVTQVTALFSSYAKRHPELEGEELLNGFMTTIRSGVNQGYDEAFEILDGLGAFGFDGVQSGVEKTKELIDQKLAAYEAEMRKQLGIGDPEVSEDTIAPAVTTDLLAQGGAHTLSVDA
jgi:hypothetical protein